MNLIIVTDNQDGTGPLQRAAENAGYHILKWFGPKDQVSPYMKGMLVDAVIFVSDGIETAELRLMRTISEQCPKPMLVLTRDARHEAMQQAINAGASSYVVNCEDIGRLPALLQVAQTRFASQQALLAELDDARNALAHRKMIEKAKGIIMKQRGLDEDTAYKAMRKLAMDRNRKLADVAGQIVTASELLT